MINIIYAASPDGVIGHNGGIPWDIPDDLEMFKYLTIGKTVIMGRRTWESLPKRPLVHRHCVVLSSKAIDTFEDKPHDVISHPDEIITKYGNEETFIIGGERLIEWAMPHADRVYRTVVHTACAGDTFAPDIPTDEYLIIYSKDWGDYTREIWTRFPRDTLLKCQPDRLLE